MSQSPELLSGDPEKQATANTDIFNMLSWFNTECSFHSPYQQPAAVCIPGTRQNNLQLTTNETSEGN